MYPTIGVTMGYDKNGMIRPGVDYSFIRREYGEELKAAGAQPIFFDPSIDPVVAAELCDGIVISGGEDIDPALYGSKISPTNLGKAEPRVRTDWERELIEACDKKGIPILGVCYGGQLLNVHYGGTLYQDIVTELGSNLSHGTSDASVVHEVSFEQDFLGFREGDMVATAHRHHQAVRDIAPGFEVIARAPDGTIEAIAGNGHYGIQWHAESDGTANKIYGAFVQTCLSRVRTPRFADLVPLTETV